MGERVVATTDAGEIVGSRSGSGVPVLLLHGGPGLQDYVATLADVLTDGLAVAHYQQRGLAPSSLHGALTVEQHVADAVAFMDALVWREAVVVGHSWGAHLALHLAVSHPDRVAGVVGIGSLGAVGDGGAGEMMASLMGRLSDEERERFHLLAAGDADAQSQLLGTLWPHYFSTPSAAVPYPGLAVNPGDTTMDSVTQHLAAGTLERALPALRCPVMFVHGRHDPIPLAACELTAALIPDAAVRVTETGHFPWLEDPAAVAEIVTGFATAAVPV